jgi:hypothetical protein
MSNKTKLGMNRTGIALSPRMGPEMLRATELFPPTDSDGESIAGVRAVYAAQREPIGTMPPPGSLREAAVSALEALKGNKEPAYVDKLGARLAFERTGTRLYQTLLPKLAGGPSWEGGPTEAEVQSILADELHHFHLVRRYIEELGSDPTVQTPSADVSATASLGLVQVLGDPRMSLRQALDAILVAELVDNEGWTTLIDLASSLGRHEHVREFQMALAAEARHLELVRAWVQTAILSDTSMTMDEKPGGDQESLEQVPLH